MEDDRFEERKWVTQKIIIVILIENWGVFLLYMTYAYFYH